MKRILGLGFLLIALVIGGCSDSNGDDESAGDGASFPLTLQSVDGQSVTLDAAPQRIVSLDASATEIICEIGAGDLLAAVERFQNCPAGSSAKPAVDAYQPNLEAVAAYRPDFVYLSYNPAGFVESLRRLNIPVLFVEVADTIDGVYDTIELFGNITGRSDEANDLIDDMKQRQDDILDKIGDADGPRIYHELDNTYYSAAPQSFVGDFYTLLKASNIAEGATTDFPQLSAEVIIQRNPEVIVLADEGAQVTPASVKERAGWNVIEAVKNDRICSIEPDLVLRPGPRVIDGLQELAECLYPEKF